MSFPLRFIIDNSRGAAFNMAADLYLMERCSDGAAAFVRLYSWQGATVTIGRMQRASAQLDLAALDRDGLLWIRRPTGGRAVLHFEDLTYSCIFSRRDTISGDSVATTYEVICRCLRNGLNKAGVLTTVSTSTSPLIRSGPQVKLPCFLAPNRNEIMAGGKKLIGSAQYRNTKAVLQHGSLPISAQYRRLPYYLKLDEDERRRQISLLSEKSISLQEVDPSVTIPKLIASLMSGFMEVLDCRACEEPWSGGELEEIDRMIHDPGFMDSCFGDSPPLSPYWRE